VEDVEPGAKVQKVSFRDKSGKKISFMAKKEPPSFKGERVDVPKPNMTKGTGSLPAVFRRKGRVSAAELQDAAGKLKKPARPTVDRDRLDALVTELRERKKTAGLRARLPVDEDEDMLGGLFDEPAAPEPQTRYVGPARPKLVTIRTKDGKVVSFVRSGQKKVIPADKKKCLINPPTGRAVAEGGRIYKRLVKQGMTPNM
jgi:hypothetical protein